MKCFLKTQNLCGSMFLLTRLVAIWIIITKLLEKIYKDDFDFKTKDTEHRGKKFFKRIDRKCTKYNFVAPLNFTDCYTSGLDQKFCSSSNLGLEQKLPKWNFIEISSLRFDLTFSISGFGYSSNSGLKQKCPKWNLTESLARGSTKHFTSKTLLKVKLYLFSSRLF